MSGIYTLFVENSEGTRLGVLNQWEKLEVIKRYNNVGKNCGDNGNAKSRGL